MKIQSKLFIIPRKEVTSGPSVNGIVGGGENRRKAHVENITLYTAIHRCDNNILYYIIMMNHGRPLRARKTREPIKHIT